MERFINREDLDFDREHIWHPYTSPGDPIPVYPVTGAHGVYIELDGGRRVIDGMSSWWCMVHGYDNPRLNAAIKAQAESFSHVMFGGLTHKPAIDLARKLVSVTPGDLDKVFFCDSGSVAVEVALKMALQYMQAKGETGRNSLATIRGGYHGDTWHAMSVCDPVGGMHSLFSGRLPLQHFAPRPGIAFGEQWDETDFAPMRELLDRHGDTLAAVVVEPIVQGAGGMRFYHPQYLRRLREECTSRGILLVADEIATGFGRTGRMFACQWADVVPDIMCLGKALTGGYMSFAAVLASAHVAGTIAGGEPGVFMHGPTFMANPLACAAANASLDMLAEEPPFERIERMEAIMKEILGAAKGLEGVEDVRVLGAIGVVEMRRPVDMAEIQRRFVEHGIWLRPFGRLIYTMPPFVITDRELTALCRGMVEVMREIGG